MVLSVSALTWHQRSALRADADDRFSTTKKAMFFPFIEIPKLATKMFYYMAETMAMVIVGDASSLCSFCSELIDGDSSVFIKIGICFYVFLLIIICNTTMSRLGICSIV